jgi:AcrR family transcriptional regulator
MKTKQTDFATDLFLRINDEKRDRIIKAAVEEFSESGYTAANVNHIAASAGISVGALYKYFATKDDLFMYIVEVAAEKISEYVNTVVESDIRLLSKIERLLRMAQDYSGRDPNLIRLYNVFSAESDSKRANIIAEKLESITARAYSELIAKAQETGEVRGDIDAGILAFMLDNQFMMVQFSFACDYYKKRCELFVGANNVADREHMIRSILKVMQSLLGIA